MPGSFRAKLEARLPYLRLRRRQRDYAVARYGAACATGHADFIEREEIELADALDDRAPSEKADGVS